MRFYFNREKLRLSTHTFTEFSSTQYFPMEHSAEVEEKEHWQSLTKEVVPSAAIQTFLSQTKNKKKRNIIFTLKSKNLYKIHK